MKFRRWTVAERLLLALWLSLLLHAALFWLPAPPGQAGGAHAGLRVRLAMRPVAAPAAAPPVVAASPAIGGTPASAAAASHAEAAAPDRLRLGVDIYYPARELDHLAQERGAIALPDVDLPGGAPQALTVLVFISETGRVDAVRFEDAAPAALADAIRPVFGAASYQPALKDGVPVKSYKRIRIEPQAEPAAPSPALSH